MKYAFIGILIAIVFWDCNSKGCHPIVATIDNIDTSGIYLSYEYLGDFFYSKLPLETLSIEDFGESDSMIIEVNPKNPEEFKAVSIVHRVWPSETSIVSINKRKEEVTYGYHTVDEKPLFPGASNEFDNDSLLLDFFVQRYIQHGKIRTVGVNINIDKHGKVAVESIHSKDNNIIKVVKLLLDKLPQFSPPVHNGDSVAVSYLIGVPIEIGVSSKLMLYNK
ncbi:MAG: hypothetical protein ACK5L5_12820 [Bacteroidales bacterium]